jgi:hypothetical protein
MQLPKLKLTDLILSNNENTGVRILKLTGIAWMPLLLLTFFEGTLFAADITIPFIKDTAPYVRCLIVISLLVLADNIIEPMMARVLKYMKTSGLIADSEKENFNSIVDRMANSMNSKWILSVLMLLAILFSFLMQSDYIDMWTEREVTSWMLYQGNGLVDETLAGKWFLFVSSPLVSFLLYRWLWRFLVWSLFLYRVSRMKLQLCASHTDLAGGLGVIGAGHSLFAIVFFILATLLASDLAANMLYEDEVIISAKQVAIVFIFTSIIVLLVPLLFFSRQLVDIKHDALVEYSTLQNQISSDFHRQWIKGEADDLVDSMQPSAMADYSAVFENVSNMRLLPVTPKMIMFQSALLFIPFIPLALIETSLWDIVQKIGGTLF